jgi:hypothetical protein
MQATQTSVSEAEPGEHRSRFVEQNEDLSASAFRPGLREKQGAATASPARAVAAAGADLTAGWTSLESSDHHGARSRIHRPMRASMYR